MGSPRNGAPGSCELSNIDAGNLGTSLLEDQQTLLIIESSLQPLRYFNMDLNMRVKRERDSKIQAWTSQGRIEEQCAQV